LVHTYNSSTQEAKAGGSQVQSQPKAAKQERERTHKQKTKLDFYLCPRPLIRALYKIHTKKTAP
jgi:hypothetical protein